jgi:hypothetical protein
MLLKYRSATLALEAQGFGASIRLLPREGATSISAWHQPEYMEEEEGGVARATPRVDPRQHTLSCFLLPAGKTKGGSLAWIAARLLS